LVILDISVHFVVSPEPQLASVGHEKGCGEEDENDFVHFRVFI
jgi:hypothetical protein